MSLCIEVGQLARCVALKDRAAVRDVKRDLKKINQVLKGVRLPEHHEPEHLKDESWSCRIAGHYLTPLRRLAAHARLRLVQDEGDEFEEWPAPWDRVWSVDY